MPEEEGYIGVINLLRQAEAIMEEGEAKELVRFAIVEVIKIAQQGITNLEIGMDLGRLLKDAEDLSDQAGT